MLLIVGLGNPGKEYEKTRHSAGFMALDKIAEYFKFEPFVFDKKFNALVSIGKINDKRTLLMKPQTFMNSSGISVKTAMSYYKIAAQDLTVIQDELDIDIGNYKISNDRTSAGHKGIQSIIDQIGTKNFTRYRIGIESAREDIASDKFVLENFNEEEYGLIYGVIDKICIDIKERA